MLTILCTYLKKHTESKIKSYPTFTWLKWLNSYTVVSNSHRIILNNYVPANTYTNEHKLIKLHLPEQSNMVKKSRGKWVCCCHMEFRDITKHVRWVRSIIIKDKLYTSFWHIPKIDMPWLCHMNSLNISSYWKISICCVELFTAHQKYL